MPTACRYGNTTLPHIAPYSTHQVMELPPITMDITHWVLSQADCPSCGHRLKAHLPPEPHTGYGPRLSALIGEMAGVQGTSRSRIRTFCASVLGIPIGLGTIRNVIDRLVNIRIRGFGPPIGVWASTRCAGALVPQLLRVFELLLQCASCLYSGRW